jgi:hypothetical protein
MLVMTSLQKRLLSSIEAFARTLRVHRSALERQVEKQRGGATANLSLLKESPGFDDERAELLEVEIQSEEDAQMIAATQLVIEVISPRELELLEKMTQIAESARHQPDRRIGKLVDWIKANQCPDLGKAGANWNNRRVLIFTEYIDTKRYLEHQLQQAIALSDREHERIDVFTGGMGDERRELINTLAKLRRFDCCRNIMNTTKGSKLGKNLG